MATKKPAKKTCSSCDYYDAKGSKTLTKGRCHRYPQVIIVDRTNWCGEHQPK
jgi:hypothetical protein